MTRAVYWFVCGLSLLAIAAGFACYAQNPIIADSSARASFWFAGLILLGHIAIYGNRQGATQTVAYLPTLTAIAAAPTWLTVLLVGAVTLLSESAAKREPIKKVFNIAKGVLGTALTVFAYRAIGGVELSAASSAPGFLQSLPSFAGAALVFLVLDSTALSLVVALSTQTPLRKAWSNLGLKGLPSDMLAAPLAYVFGRVYLAFGGAGVAWLGLPLVGLRQLYSANWELKRTNEELLELMVAAIEARDPYTSGHSRRVAKYSRLIAAGVGLSPKKIDEVERAALLHDVGKIDEKYAPLLRKASRLTAEEEEVMQTHAARSAELVAKVSYLNTIVPFVRHHHEAWDGTGYPDQLAGERIPLASRIIAFADTIDAMTSERPYRAGLSPEVVRAELVRCRGSQFDPELTDRVISGDIWASIFPAASPRPEPQGLTLIRASARRLG